MKIYYCKINEFNDLTGMEYLTPKRRERVERYRFLPAKAAGLAAGLLLQMVLGNDYENHLSVNEHGKPFLKDTPFFFNLSHSGDYVVLAVSDCEIGIDIEKIAPYNANVADRCFTDDEIVWMQDQEKINDNSHFLNIHHPFYYLWTGKEAVMKAFGRGFSMNPESFCLLPIENGKHPIQEKTWYLYWETLDNHQICIASAQDIKISWEYMSREKLMEKMFKNHIKERKES